MFCCVHEVCSKGTLRKVHNQQRKCGSWCQSRNVKVLTSNRKWRLRFIRQLQARYGSTLSIGWLWSHWTVQKWWCLCSARDGDSGQGRSGPPVRRPLLLLRQRCVPKLSSAVCHFIEGIILERVSAWRWTFCHASFRPTSICVVQVCQFHATSNWIMPNMHGGQNLGTNENHAPTKRKPKSTSRCWGQTFYNFELTEEGSLTCKFYTACSHTTVPNETSHNGVSDQVIVQLGNTRYGQKTCPFAWFTLEKGVKRNEDSQSKQIVLILPLETCICCGPTILIPPGSTTSSYRGNGQSYDNDGDQDSNNRQRSWLTFVVRDPCTKKSWECMLLTCNWASAVFPLCGQNEATTASKFKTAETIAFALNKTSIRFVTSADGK